MFSVTGPKEGGGETFGEITSNGEWRRESRLTERTRKGERGRRRNSEQAAENEADNLFNGIYFGTSVKKINEDT